MVLGRVTIRFLNTIDKTVRGFVRQWIALLNDMPIAYFHAPVTKGGLNIQSLRWMAPLQRQRRLIAMLPHHNIGKVGLISREGNSPMHEETHVRSRQRYLLFQCAKVQMGAASP